jgi:hypothetical protein
VTRIEEINSRLGVVKDADRRKVKQESIIRADKPQEHAGNSAFAAVYSTDPCG